MGRSHGLFLDSNGKKARLYSIWENLKARCNNPKDSRYHRYGGRGILVHPEWNATYGAFHAWAITSGYSDSLTIDRINNDGNYEPANCRWVTQKVQGNNRSTNKFLVHVGQRKTIAEWSDQTGLAYHVIKNRLKRGWPVKDALDTSPLVKGIVRPGQTTASKVKAKVVIDGRSVEVAELAKDKGILYNTMVRNIRILGVSAAIEKKYPQRRLCK